MDKVLYQRTGNIIDGYDILEKLGYSKTLAEKRVKIYRNTSAGVGLYETCKFEVDYDVLIVGSRGDGTGIYVDSDVDKLLVQNKLECIEKRQLASKPKQNHTVLEIDTEGAPNGYTYLQFITNAKNLKDKLHTNILEALENRNDKLYVRNDCILSPAIGREYTSADSGWIEKNLVHFKSKTGPSKPYIIQTPFLPSHIILDDVLAFRCDFPTVKDAWCNRKRCKDWPSSELIELIRNLDVYVVPVGMKGSQNEHLQWRICLTQAELALVQSFNDTQIKLLGALKLITKHHLHPICSNITSYIVKNILFWQMEQKERHEWKRENFTVILQDSLNYLKTCVMKKELPNYMISERNMFQGKTSKLEQDRLRLKLDFLIEAFPSTLIKDCVLKEIVETDIDDIADEIKEKLKINKDLIKEEFSSSVKAVNEKERELMMKNLSLTNIQALSTEEEERILQAIPKRMLREQFVLAIFANCPKQIAIILKHLFEAKQEIEIIKIISQEVFPYIRKHNPYEFFKELSDMSDTEIFHFCAGKREEQSCVLL